jgi:hypothetical protein
MEKTKSNKGRKKSSNPRIKNVTVRYTKNEYEQLINEYSNASTKITLAAYIRLISLGESKSRIINKTHIAKLLAEIKQIGININQIAYQLNQRSGSVNIDQIDKSLKQFTIEISRTKQKIQEL